MFERTPDQQALADAAGEFCRDILGPTVKEDDEAERGSLVRVLAIDQVQLMALIRLAELHERRGEIGSATDRGHVALSQLVQVPNPTSQLNEVIDRRRAFSAECAPKEL